MWTRAELKANAKAAFKSNYWFCVLAALILTFCTGGSGSFSSFFENDNESGYDSVYAQELNHTVTYEQNRDINLFNSITDEGLGYIFGGMAIILIIFILAALVVGILLSVFVFSIIQIGGCRFFTVNTHEKAAMNELVSGFNREYYMKNVKIMFFMNLYLVLWTLLFIIPGIIKAYEYRLIPYILADNPEISMEDAFALSKKMMDGDKMNAFVLDLSFIGWMLLSGITLGIVGTFYVNPYIHATNAEFYLKMKSQIAPPAPTMDYNAYYN